MRTDICSSENLFSATPLEESVVVEAVRRGESARAMATANDPPARGGYNAWAETVRALRDQLCPQGWTKNDRKNLSSVVSPCGRHSIVVVAGDRYTGLPGKTPQPRSQRGEATSDAVEASQLALFGAETKGQAKGPNPWFLLRYWDKATNEIRIEISLPEAIDEKGFVTKWKSRHILHPFTIDPDDLDHSFEDEDEIEFEIRRKGERV